MRAGFNPQDHFEHKGTKNHEKFSSSYSENANKIIEQAKQEMAVNENLNFLIDFATTAMVAKVKSYTEEEPKNFNNAWNHPDMESRRKCNEAIKK